MRYLLLPLLLFATTALADREYHDHDEHDLSYGDRMELMDIRREELKIEKERLEIEKDRESREEAEQSAREIQRLRDSL